VICLIKKWSELNDAYIPIGYVKTAKEAETWIEINRPPQQYACPYVYQQLDEL